MNKLMSELLRTKLAENLQGLSANPYPGRGIVMGIDDSGQYIVQVYFLTGRSQNSKNRVLKSGGNARVFTALADPSKQGDTSLTIYDAMLESDAAYVVSNGSQTADVLNEIMSFDDGPATRFALTRLLGDAEYEPDAPNYTPRITGLYRWDGMGEHLFEFVVIRKASMGKECDTLSFTYRREGGSDEVGIGHCVTTYTGEGSPLPPFAGEPIMVPLDGDIDQIARTFWNALPPAYRVSLVVKFIPIAGGDSLIQIINENQEV